jgi:excisionase family DNA binding protein
MAVHAKHSADLSEPGLKTVTCVAKFLCLSRSKVYAMMDLGELPYVKFGKSRRIRWADVLALVQGNTINGDGRQTR